MNSLVEALLKPREFRRRRIKYTNQGIFNNQFINMKMQANYHPEYLFLFL